MTINWPVRIKNKAFWLTFIPAVLVLAKAVASLFGFNLELEVFGDKLMDVAEAVFVVLGIVGIVNDPTTKTLSDSDRAMNYTEPN